MYDTRVESIRKAEGTKAMDNPTYLTHCLFCKLVDGTVTTHLVAERPQRDVWQAFLGKVGEFSQRSGEAFVISAVFLGLEVVVVKVGEERRKIWELWGNGGLANARGHH